GHEHQVKLDWEGFIDLEADRITRVLLSARGTEKLRFGSAPPVAQPGQARPEVACLPGGRPVDLHCGVRYGIIGTPVPATAGASVATVARAAAPPPPAAPAPATETVRQLL